MIELMNIEIAVLKELKAAGERGRLRSRLSRSEELARLVKISYVKVKPASKDFVVYFITPWGRHDSIWRMPKCRSTC